VRPAHQHLRGADRPQPGQLQQLRRDRGVQHLYPGESQQPLVADRIRTDRGSGQQSAYRIGDGGSEGVAVGINTDHAVDALPGRSSGAPSDRPEDAGDGARW
jgi:hypothetical protein